MTLGEHARGFTEDYWCPAGSNDESATTSASAAPVIDGALWVALVKMNNGDAIAAAEQDWLAAQNLVETIDGVNALTARGRAALGI